jgi:hypothetical protein
MSNVRKCFPFARPARELDTSNRGKPQLGPADIAAERSPLRWGVMDDDLTQHKRAAGSHGWPPEFGAWSVALQY